MIPQIMCVFKKRCCVTLLKDQMHHFHLVDNKIGEKMSQTLIEGA